MMLIKVRTAMLTPMNLPPGEPLPPPPHGMPPQPPNPGEVPVQAVGEQQ